MSGLFVENVQTVNEKEGTRMSEAKSYRDSVKAERRNENVE